MIIKNNKDVPEVVPEEDGVKDVLKKVLIGPEDGSENIIMRKFKVLPGGHTPLHSHKLTHVVKIETGKGVLISEKGEETVLTPGQSLFIDRHEKHQFRNPYDEPFEFICTIENLT
jgi:quercetin dioxygenase-like cupin family protein